MSFGLDIAGIMPPEKFRLLAGWLIPGPDINDHIDHSFHPFRMVQARKPDLLRSRNVGHHVPTFPSVAIMANATGTFVQQRTDFACNGG